MTCFRKVLPLSVLIILSVLSSLHGQEQLTEALKEELELPSEFMISIWRAGDGLPANEIHDLKVTPDGYLWLGTAQGLVRFDGMRFETFLSTPSGSRYGTRVGALEVDSHGNLWLAPDQIGLLQRQHGGFAEVLTNDTVLRTRVVSLCDDRNGSLLWIDERGKVGRFSINNPDRTHPILGGGHGNASRWMRDFQDGIWLVHPRRIKAYEKGRWREVNVPGGATMVAAPRRAGGLWIARDAKLRSTGTKQNPSEVVEFPWKGQTRVTCLMEDTRSRLWIGTAGQGLFCYSSGKFYQVVAGGSSISCLLQDHEGNVWAGTRGNGLFRVRERRIFKQNSRTGLANDFVRSLTQDGAGRIWIATAENGLGWWANGAWNELDEAEGWRHQDVLSVAPSKDGGVWISTAQNGLWHWTEGKSAKRVQGQKMPKEAVMDLLEDRTGRVWMVTDNSGIYCLERGECKNYTSKHGLPSDLIRRVIEDEKGEIWSGDWEGGIARFDGKRWQIVRPASGHRDAVRSLAAKDGTIWIGTSAGGLLRLQQGKTSRITLEHGLPDMCIQQLILDEEDSIWGGTPHKLFRLPLNQLQAVADGAEQHVNAVVYGRSDGLPHVTFSSWCDPRSWRATNGELWLATANGAIHFRPEELRVGPAPLPILEQILLDGKTVTSTQLKQLRPGPGRLEFRFSAPCLTAPERVRFRYQLTGVDQGWVEAGMTRTATYASIPAGRHVFKVIASSPEGVWSSEQATVNLAVHPFFWQTNWFFAGIAAMTAGGGVWIIRRTTVRRLNRRLERLRQEHALDRERARIAQDIHDELGANLTSIGLLADLGNRHKGDPTAVSKELEQISETARESVAAMDAIVWALNPRNDSLDNFANYLAQFTRDFFRPTNIKTRLELPTDLPQQPLAMEMRHQLFLIVKESFNNIVRHANATEVRLSLASEEGYLRLCITDNGRGLSGKTRNEGGNGLSNLRTRIERLGGTLWLETKLELGTKLEFHLPLPKIKK